MAEPTPQAKVVRASQAGTPAASNVQALKTDFRTTAPLPAIEASKQPEAKRSKSEQTHEGRGYHQGMWHGILLGGAAVVAFAVILVTTVMVSSADFAAKMRMIETARDAALGGK